MFVISNKYDKLQICKYLLVEVEISMNIYFKKEKEYSKDELQALYLSVKWSSGNYPDRLQKAIRNSGCVFSAWDNGKLVGLINAIDDSEMTAYIHYLLVRPEYQGKGIGKKLLNLIKEEYKNYLVLVLISYDKEVAFYENCGFESGIDKTPMFVTGIQL